MNKNQTYYDLRDRVRARSLLNRSGWYTLPLALVILFLGGVGFGLVWRAPGAWSIAAAPFLALFWMQLGFIGHDAGHNQVFEATERNRRLGLFCYPFLLGLAFRPWVIQHNLHHAETNVLDSDPDLQHPLLAFSEEAAREKKGAVRWLVRYQAYAFPFLAMFATLAFRASAWLYVIRGTTVRVASDKYKAERRLELLLLVANLGIWVVGPGLAVGWSSWLPAFVLGQLLLGVHMAFVFAPNHKGMPTYVDASALTFMEQQVLTSRNVRGGLLVDFMYGGLNYQIEHHLFPTMPRRSLPACRTLVRACCATAGLPYTEETLVQSFKTLFSSLDDIGRETIARPVAELGPTALLPAKE